MFSLSVAEPVVMRKTHGRLILKSQQKVVKNRRFLSKTAVFVVDDTRLELVTSRTSTKNKAFF